MKNFFQLAVVITVFLLSVILNILVLERGGSFVNYVLLYGASGRFSLNKGMTLLAMFIGVGAFLSAFKLHHLMHSMCVVGRHLTLVSMYMNGIALVAIIMMAIFPTVHFS
jgi:hypothetical protein